MEYTYIGAHFLSIKLFINLKKNCDQNIMFLSQKQGLAWIKEFFEVPMLTVCFFLQIVQPFTRLCEGIGPNLRKDDSCDNTLSI